MRAVARPWLGAVLLLVAAPTIAAARTARAVPPPPPPPPGCSKACSGPPPPPTPVPTPAPTVVAPQPVVTVHVAARKVARGHVARIAVRASTNDRVTLQVYYHHGKPTTWQATIGSSGSLMRTWRIPRKAPVGPALIKVTVDGAAGKVRRLLTFRVVR